MIVPFYIFLGVVAVGISIIGFNVFWHYKYGENPTKEDKFTPEGDVYITFPEGSGKMIDAKRSLIESEKYIIRTKTGIGEQQHVIDLRCDIKPLINEESLKNPQKMQFISNVAVNGERTPNFFGVNWDDEDYVRELDMVKDNNLSLISELRMVKNSRDALQGIIESAIIAGTIKSEHEGFSKTEQQGEAKVIKERENKSEDEKE